MRLSFRDLAWIVPVLVVGAILAALDDDVPWWIVPAIVAATLVLVVVAQRRSDRRTLAETAALGVDFSSSTWVPIELLRTVPQFASALRNQRLAFLVGRVMLGRLLVGVEGVAFVPNRLTRVYVRRSELRLHWREVEATELHEQPGVFDNGLLELHLSNGAVCAFAVTRQARLAPVLTASAPPPIAPATL